MTRTSQQECRGILEFHSFIAHYKKLWTSARAFIVTVSYSILFSFSLHTVFVKISFLFLFKSFSDNFIGFHNDCKCFRIYLFYHSFYRIHLLVIACTHDHVFFFHHYSFPHLPESLNHGLHIHQSVLPPLFLALLQSMSSYLHLFHT